MAKNHTESNETPVEATPVSTSTNQPTEKRLTKSRTDRIICGVCSGLAEYFGVDPIIVRVLFILFTLTAGTGVLVYIVLCLVMPEADATTGTVTPSTPEEIHARWQNTQILIGMVVIAFGLFLFAGNFGLLDIGAVISTFLKSLWPVFIIVLGILILQRSFNGRKTA